MDLGDECPDLLARCRPSKPYTLDEFVERCRNFLSELIPLHPGFERYHFVNGPKKAPALAADMSNLKDWIWSHGWRKKFAASYTDRTPDGHLTGASVGQFDLSLSNWKGFDGKFDMRLSTGAPSGSGTICVMTLPRRDHPEFLAGPLPMQLFELTLKHWPVRYASYGTGGWNEKVNRVEDQAERIGCFELGWHTFVNDPSVAEALPADVPVRRVGQGIVFTLFDRMPDYNNPEHLERGLRVRDALKAAGKLRLYGD